MTLPFVNLRITNCVQCPHHDTMRTHGAGYALDYMCLGAKGKPARKIVGYVERHDEEPQDHEIPDWCPLANEKN